MIIVVSVCLNTDYSHMLEHSRPPWFSVLQINQGLYGHLRQHHNIATDGHTLMI